MNCRPGDLAIIIAESPSNPGTAGLIVEVIKAAPLGDFYHPDGMPARCSTTECWVVKFQRPFMVRHLSGTFKPANYSSCPDSKLRPLRPGDELPADETTTPREVSHA